MRRPSWLDLLPSSAVVVLVVADWFVQLDVPGISALTLVCGVLAGASLVLRRQRPLTVLAVVWVTGVLPTCVQGTDPGFYASYVPFLVAGYSVATHARTVRQTLLMPVATVAIYLVFLVRAPSFREANQVVFNLVSLVLVYGAGRTVRALRDRVDLASELAELRLREHELGAREALVAERERIARELHDVIAHEVSVMVIHAAAAQRLVPDLSVDVAEALDQIQRSGRTAIEELHLLLGMLRGEDADRAPQPGLGSVADLVDEARRSGLDIVLEVRGQVRPLGGALDVSAYRVVQEALTNVLKHAGTSRARVCVDYRPGEIALQVVDDGGPGDSLTSLPSGGHGLVGMRERVRMFGGVLEAGAGHGGGWSVTAVLPTLAETGYRG